MFEFIEQVQHQVVNNALVPFSDFEDIQSYLKQQWAGMLFSFLADDNERRRVSDTLAELAIMSDRIQVLSNQILQSVGTDKAKVTVELYDLMLQYEVVKDLLFFGLKPTPKDVLLHESFYDCIASFGKELKVKKNSKFSLSSNFEISAEHMKAASAEYKKMRSEMTGLIKSRGLEVEDLVNENARQT